MSLLLQSGQAWSEIVVVAEPGNPPAGQDGSPNVSALNLTMHAVDNNGNYSDDTANWSLAGPVNVNADGFTFLLQGAAPAGRGGWTFYPVATATFSDGNSFVARLETIQVGKLAATVASGDCADAAAIKTQTDQMAFVAGWDSHQHLLVNAASAYGNGADQFPAVTAIANAVLAQGVAGVESSADTHSLAYVVLAMSEWAIAATQPNQLTVFRSDGVTPFATKTLARQANVKPIVSIK